MSSDDIDLYNDLIVAKIKVDSHASDLYFPVTIESTQILEKYPIHLKNSKTFRSAFDHSLWYDIPFAYTPFWDEYYKNIPHKTFHI